MTAPEKPERLIVQHACANDPAVDRAARLLRAGKLVAFPTETVYGLGALVDDRVAVRSIFEAKNRPRAMPLIVHVGSFEQACLFVSRMPSMAESLARDHWPGPLTLVLDRSGRVSNEVSGGQNTVGVRMPNHPVALALIEALGEPIAAPSANLHSQLPPVRAEHVLSGLRGRIHAVLDGGRCPGGLESTVVDVRSEPGSILRSGAVAAERLGIDFDNTTGSRPTVLDGKRLDQEWLDGPWLHVGAPESFDQWAKDQGVTVGRIVVGGEGLSEGVWRLPADLEGYASQMYDVLHDLWSARVCRVWIDAPSTELSWGPIWDRITRLVGSLEAPCSILWH